MNPSPHAMPSNGRRSQRPRPRPLRSAGPAVAASIAASIAGIGSAAAQRDLTDIPAPDPAAELADFVVADGFEVNLFAADPMIRKPIQIAFDEKGRLWVAGSAIYPQIKPGQPMNDEIVVLEDTDRDGAADKHTVFAGGFLIPTGVLPGDGGAYVANSTDLVHLRDTDGDGVADEERIVLSGFGTEDTHHIIHAFRWGPSGEIFFNQSIYIHSHVETPWGVRRLNGGGIWRFQPDSLELDVFTRGQVNPWGHVFDDWGQSFTTDGAYFEGINFAFPGAQFATAVDATRVLNGLNTGEPKHCGLARITGRHFPESWEGNLIANDFRANRINRFAIREEGSGFAAVKQPDLLRSKRVTFRPVDAKIGPDGALYIADWYNPIIQHGEVDFRDPRRDQAHGRIWRISAKGRPTAPPVDLTTDDPSRLLEALRAPEQWTREMARVRLTRLDPIPTAEVVRAWEGTLDRTDPRFEHLRLQALWVLQGLDAVDEALLDAVLRSEEPRARAAAIRALGWGFGDLSARAGLLAEAAVDGHPRVRLEAVRALGSIGTIEAATAAARALDHPMDRFLDYALWLTMRETADAWLPAVREGTFDFEGGQGRLLFALKAVNTPETAEPLAGLLARSDVAPGIRREIVDLLRALAGPRELRAVFDMGMDGAAETGLRVAAIESLAAVARERRQRPEGDLDGVLALIEGNADAAPLRIAGVRLAGAWGLDGALDRLSAIAADAEAPQALRGAALEGLAGFPADQSRAALEAAIVALGSSGLVHEALDALVRIDPAAAARAAVPVLAELESDEGGGATRIFNLFVSRKGGSDLLAEALADGELAPPVSEAGLRAITASGAGQPGLEAALRAAGQVMAAPARLEPEEMAAFVREVEERGDARRGEGVYRRQALLCVQCHAIGGAGGRVGPDLVSIGASAPVDYLVESLLEPNSKVKEGYHVTTVTTKDGRAFAGTGARRTDTHLVLVNAGNAEERIPLDSIASETIAQTSLMPPALTASLSRREFVDLVRFLHDLGRTPAFSIGDETVVRRWRVKRGDQPEVPVTSRVSGDLPVDEVAALLGGTGRTFVAFDVEVPEAMEVEIAFNETDGIDRVMVGGTIHAIGNPVTVPLETGRQEIRLRLDTGGRKFPIRVTLKPAAGAAGFLRLP